ncbi:MAG: NAD(+)/NADH kinase [Sedimentisphaerales bacterium]|nr:NAD(+)/NADH kinase [Sedimentisphaerales bacterium]
MIEPKDGYICFIVNPKSGSSHSRINCRPLEYYFTGRGFEVRANLTKSLEHACELATEAAVDYDCALVVAVGGDGTIREVIHGLEGSDKPLLIVPEGTENLLASELGYDEKIETIIRIFEEDHRTDLDVGSINGKCFTSIAGFGFDGLVVDRVHNWRDGHITHMDYFWPLWRVFWSHKFEPMKVKVDGKVIFEGQGLVFVGNISRYALGLNILHEADYKDGLLDVCIYKCKTRFRLLKHAALTLIKRHWNRSDVIYTQGAKITISSSCKNILSEIDGDPGPVLPVKIEIIPQAVKVLVLAGAKPAGIRTRIKRILK